MQSSDPLESLAGSGKNLVPITGILGVANKRVAQIVLGLEAKAPQQVGKRLISKSRLGPQNGLSGRSLRGHHALCWYFADLGFHADESYRGGCLSSGSQPGSVFWRSGGAAASRLAQRHL